jgi:hypothetical protein
MLQAGRSRVRLPMRSLDFQLTKFFQLHYGPGVESASNRNEYGNLPVGKGRPAHKAGSLTPIYEPIV